MATEWKDEFYVRAYELSRGGCKERELAAGLGISIKQLREWKEAKPALREAAEKGQRECRACFVTAARQEEKLTAQELRFCEEFVTTFNISEAAIKAGYGGGKNRASAAAVANKVLKRERVQNELRRIFEKKQARNEIDGDRVAQELKRIAFSNIGELFDENGMLKNITEISEDLLRSISSIKVRYSTDSEGNINSTETEFKFWDKVKSLELLAKVCGLMRTPGVLIDDKSQHVHIESNPYANVSDEELLQVRERLADLRAGSNDLVLEADG